MKKLLLFNFSILCAAMLLTSNTMQAALGTAGRRAAAIAGRRALSEQAGQQAAAAAGRRCITTCNYDPSSGTLGGLGQRLNDLKAAEEQLLEAQENTKKTVAEKELKRKDQIEEMQQKMNLVETAYEAATQTVYSLEQAESAMVPLQKKVAAAKEKRDQAIVNRFTNKTPETENQEIIAEAELKKANDEFEKVKLKVSILQQQKKATPELNDALSNLEKTFRNPNNLLQRHSSGTTYYENIEDVRSSVARMRAGLDDLLQRIRLETKQEEAKKAASVIAALEAVRDDVDLVDPEIRANIETRIAELKTIY